MADQPFDLTVRTVGFQGNDTVAWVLTGSGACTDASASAYQVRVREWGPWAYTN